MIGSRLSLKVELNEFDGGLEKRGVKDDTKKFSLRIWNSGAVLKGDKNA